MTERVAEIPGRPLPVSTTHIRVALCAPALTATVTIHGAGMLGLAACAMAAVRRAAAIIVIEPDAGRRARALRVGRAEKCARLIAASTIRRLEECASSQWNVEPRIRAS